MLGSDKTRPTVESIEQAISQCGRLDRNDSAVASLSVEHKISDFELFDALFRMIRQPYERARHEARRLRLHNLQFWLPV